MLRRKVDSDRGTAQSQSASKSTPRTPNSRCGLCSLPLHWLWNRGHPCYSCEEVRPFEYTYKYISKYITSNLPSLPPSFVSPFLPHSNLHPPSSTAGVRGVQQARVERATVRPLHLVRACHREQGEDTNRHR